MARFLFRHDEQFGGFTSAQLFSELRQIKSPRSLTPPRQFNGAFLARLMEERIVNSETEFPFYEWSTTEKRLIETLEEPTRRRSCLALATC